MENNTEWKAPEHPRRKPPVPQEEYQRCYDLKMCDKAAAEKLGITPGGFYFWRKKHGLPANRTERAPGKVNPGEYQTIYNLKLPDKESAERLGVSVGAFRQWRERNHLPIHPAAGNKGGAPMKSETEKQQKPICTKPAPRPMEQPEKKETVFKQTAPAAMEFSVLAEILNNISKTRPGAKVSGNMETCRAVELKVRYGTDGEEESVLVSLLA